MIRAIRRKIYSLAGVERLGKRANNLLILLNNTDINTNEKLWFNTLDELNDINSVIASKMSKTGDLSIYDRYIKLKCANIN